MSILLSDVVAALSRSFPLRTAGYEKDTVGLQVGFDSGAELTRLLVAYEITDEVIDEALALNINFIVAYHPLIFPNVDSITDSTRTGKLVRRLIQAKLALYVLHTAFDSNAKQGTSALVAQALGLSDITTLVPLANTLEKLVVFVPNTQADGVREAMWAAGSGSIGSYDECSFSVPGVGTFRGGEESNPSIGTKFIRENVAESRIEMIVETWKAPAIIRAMIVAHPYEEVAYDRYPLINGHPNFGMGSVGNLSEPMECASLLHLLSNKFDVTVLRHSRVTKQSVRRIAIVGGAGMSYYSAAVQTGADVFITGDIRYHEFYRAEHDDILLIDAGHAETERWVVAGMRNVIASADMFVDLQADIQDTMIVESRILPNAVRYYLKA